MIRAEDIDEEIEKTFAFLDEVVSTQCAISAPRCSCLPEAPPTCTSTPPQRKKRGSSSRPTSGLVQALVRTQSVVFAEEEKKLPFSASAIVGNLKIVIPLPQEFKEKEKVRLVKERDKFIAQQNTLRGQLSNTDFLEKAPPQLVEKIRNSLLQAERELTETMAKLTDLG